MPRIPKLFYFSVFGDFSPLIFALLLTTQNKFWTSAFLNKLDKSLIINILQISQSINSELPPLKRLCYTLRIRILSSQGYVSLWYKDTYAYTLRIRVLVVKAYAFKQKVSAFLLYSRLKMPFQALFESYFTLKSVQKILFYFSFQGFTANSILATKCGLNMPYLTTKRTYRCVYL